MSRLSVLVQPDTAAGASPTRSWRRLAWLVPVCYAAAAVAVTYRLWVHPPSLVPSYGHGVQSDVLLNVWFMRYIATALSHGHLPALVTTTLNWPQGVSLMWNTSLLLPGIVLAPVTYLWGPVTSLAVLLAAGFAGSALSMFVVLRKWGASISAAFIGGAFFGFSPALRMAAVDHYHLQFAVLPPLIIHFLLRLVTGRGRPLRTGAWLGLLVAAQIFIAEELLVDTILAAIIILIVLGLSKRSEVRPRIRPVAAGLGIAAAVALLICGRALWVQFAGPLNEHGSPWHVAKFGNYLSDLVTPPVGMLLHGSGALAGEGSVEYFAFLGWPLLIVLLASTIYFWRDIRIRVAALTFLILEFLSLGGHRTRIGPWHVTPVVLPWHWLEHLPLLSQALPNRLSILADGAAAVVLALAIDKVRIALPASRRWLRLAVPAIAVLILIPALPLAVPVASVGGPPGGWQKVINALHLRPGAAVLVLPLSPRPVAMEWQSITGEPISVVGGFCIAPALPGNAAGVRPGNAAQCDAKGILTVDQRTTRDKLNYLARGGPYSQGAARSVLAAAIHAWRPAAVITTDPNPSVWQYLHGFFGTPTARSGQVLAWRLGKGWHEYYPPKPVPTPSPSRSGKGGASPRTGASPHASAASSRASTTASVTGEFEYWHRFMLLIRPRESYL